MRDDYENDVYEDNGSYPQRTVKPLPGIFQGVIPEAPQETVTVYSYPTILDRLPELAEHINRELRGAGFPDSEALTRQVFALNEEVGEFTGAVRRFYGMARRTGTVEEAQKEWADVVITAFVTANTMGWERSTLESVLDTKLNEIFTRGWRETPDDGQQ